MRPGRVGALVVAIVGSLLLAGVVSAHAEVVTATPAQGSTVTEPVTQVAVTYSEALTADSRLGIYDAANDRIAIGTPDAANDHRAIAVFEPPLTQGTYTVKSTSISADDGDLDRQQWTFTVAVPATPEPTPICTDECNGQPSGGPSATPSPTASPLPSPSASAPPTTPTTSGSDAIVPVIAALAIVALGGLFLMDRGRRSGTRP